MHKKQNIDILKENQVMQWEQIKKQYQLLNHSRVETVENEKLLRKLERDLLQLNANFIIFLEKL